MFTWPTDSINTQTSIVMYRYAPEKVPTTFRTWGPRGGIWDQHGRTKGQHWVHRRQWWGCWALAHRTILQAAPSCKLQSYNKAASNPYRNKAPDSETMAAMIAGNVSGSARPWGMTTIGKRIFHVVRPLAGFQATDHVTTRQGSPDKPVPSSPWIPIGKVRNGPFTCSARAGHRVTSLRTTHAMHAKQT